MKTIIRVFVLNLLVILGSSANSQNIKGYFFYNSFYSPESGPFLETYLSVAAQSIRFLPLENGKYQGAVNITIMFKQLDQVVEFKKYDLLSPEITDTLQSRFNFIDQQRFALPDGAYDFEMMIADKNKEMLPVVISRPIIINYPTDTVSISGIELVESFSASTSTTVLSKSGYDLVPYVNNYFPETINRLTFYAEVYNTEKVLGPNEKFLITYYLESFETENSIAEFVGFKREDTKSVNVLFNDFDISHLPTGNYNLVIEIRNKQNELMASNELFIQRSNPNMKIDVADIADVELENSFVMKITKRDTVAEYIRMLSPISTQIEKNFAHSLVKTADLETLQKYFLNFWTTRDTYNPELAWKKYKEEADKADASFKTKTKKGYETDRGRVYLQYGAPNAISESYYEPNAYPYEIWHYYQLKNQRNKKFVFYSREISTNDFELIHSDAIGELANYQWQFLIHERGNAPHGLDQDQMENHWGSKIDDYFDNPR
ncbi:MAG: GWxTD domain-containing protein [Bacteroidales bacterium]|nr:GWxTD domain-containing protein [Lentimicrobiaceae bacterium]MDD5695412.1 GWxTD domain-containing protein [Bacteroidales bacterium]